MTNFTTGAKRTLITILTIFFAAAGVNRAAAQTAAPAAGREISGVVRDAATSAPLIGASVILDGTTRGVTTDVNGEFSLKNLDAGTYTVRVQMLGYKNYVSDPTTLKSGQRIDLNVSLAEQAGMLDNIVVVAHMPVGTDVGLITRMRESTVVASGISSQQISRTQDKDASEVVRRIPGISVIDDKFVIVRGLAQRYNNTWINGMAVPSAEADSRAFSFDVIPSSQIDNIVVVKTPTAEYPADYTGGFVMIQTKAASEKNSFSVSYGTGYNTVTHSEDFLYKKGSPTDWLGFDSGMRAMKDVPTRVSVDDVATVDRVTKTGFDNDWTINSKSPLLDQKFNASLSRSHATQRGDRLGMALALNYSLTSRTITDMDNSQFGVYDAVNDVPVYRFKYTDDLYTTDVRLGGMANFSWLRNGKNGRTTSTYELRNIVNQLGRDRYTLREGVRNISGYYEQQQEEYFYQSRTSYAGQLAGKHTFGGKHDDKLDWNAGYSYSNRYQPDRRMVLREKDPSDGVYDYSVNQGNISRTFTTLDENGWSAAANYSRKVGRSTFKTGLLGEMKHRDYKTRYFLYKWDLGNNTLPAGFAALPTDQVMAASNLGAPEKIHIRDESANTNNYLADNTMAAAYTALEIPVGNWSLYAGLRYEHYDTQITSFTQLATDKKHYDDYVYDNLFPSVNATYNISKRALLRLAYGQSVNRQEFRELSNSVYYDFEMFSEIKGNPDLKQATVQNFDLRYEFYPSAGEMVTVAAFYKRFENPIEWTFFDAGGSYQYSFTNALSADSYGVELDVRKSLDFAGLPGLTLTLNASIIESQVRFEDSSRDHDRPMQGQSPYLVNGGLFWQNKKNTVAVGALYNRIGKRIVGLGKVDASSGQSFNNSIPDLYELPRNAVDLTFSVRMGGHMELRGALRDILSEDLVFAQYPKFTDAGGKVHERKQVTRQFNPGRQFNLTLSATF
ncbi:MAG: TonB-dependent receptor [Rikenellaceae bacterium]|jgi:TonB-dependent receptor|nr:TonB-dependent receptor [Rikenellaceae bacterium]